MTEPKPHEQYGGFVEHYGLFIEDIVRAINTMVTPSSEAASELKKVGIDDVIILTPDERKLILRVRDAAKTGQGLLVDPDSMTWRAVGRMENIPRH